MIVFEVKLKQCSFNKYVGQGFKTHLAITRHRKELGSPKQSLPKVRCENSVKLYNRSYCLDYILDRSKT